MWTGRCGPFLASKMSRATQWLNCEIWRLLTARHRGSLTLNYASFLGFQYIFSHPIKKGELNSSEMWLNESFCHVNLAWSKKDYHDGDLHYIVRSFITFRQTFQDKLRQSMGEELKELFVGFYKPSLDVFVPEQSVRWGRGGPMSRSQSRIIWIGLFGFNQSLSSGVLWLVHTNATGPNVLFLNGWRK